MEGITHVDVAVNVEFSFGTYLDIRSGYTVIGKTSLF